MNILQIILLVICLVGLATELVTLLFWFFNYEEFPEQEIMDFPKVSILISTRDEESNIGSCLDSLLNQYYPKSKIEIIVADDDSHDRTIEIIESYCARNTMITKIDVKQDINHLKAKANALAQAADIATGDYFLFTDADVKMPPGWVRGLISRFDPNTGIISGITIVSTGSELAEVQSLEWINAISRIKVAHDIGIPVTAIGNNMAVSRNAYYEAGGFSAVKRSIVEDFEIFKLIYKKGFSYKSIIDPSVLGITLPRDSFQELIQQRARWMTGVFSTHFLIRTVIIIQLLYLPSLIGVISISLPYALLMSLLKFATQVFFMRSVYQKVGRKPNWQFLITFDFYSWYINFRSFLIYFLQKKIIWKDRKYT